MSDNETKPDADYRSKRDLAELLEVPRSSPRSLLKTHRERNPRFLLSKAFLIWIADYLKTALKPRHPFVSYDPTDPRAGIHTMPDECVVCLAADWGSGTASAYRVRDRMLAHNPHITIHLGDVYYSGKKEEFAEYFLGEDDWPRGSLPIRGGREALPSYALNANHEMYSGGFAYFDAIINHLQQKASYFCLENEHWRIVGLDSGYYSKILPLLELLPWWIALHPENRRWFRNNVLKPGDHRPIILLSHHQWFSAFDTEYIRFGRTVGPNPDILLWFWGHEHRLAGYGAHRADRRGPRVRARCIGHGGMPIEGIDDRVKRNRNLVFYDKRQAGVIDGVKIGYCGFSTLRFEGDELIVSYEDEYGLVLLEERWHAREGGANGEILGVMEDELEIVQPIEVLVA